jgi:Glycosyltransferase sugar-binding region containing DXD motif
VRLELDRRFRGRDECIEEVNVIPNILHYCFGMSPDFGGKPWSLIHYVCVRSALERIKPTACFFYYEHEPAGPWWEISREMLTLVKITSPRTIHGNPVEHPAHRADIVRLEKLMELGGIYLDCDVFVHRGFDDLRSHSCVLGSQGERGLCNAVILAEPDAPFVRKWYAEYRSFRGRGVDDHWDEHSVKVPLKLSRDFPDELVVLPQNAFFSPSWEDVGIYEIFGSHAPINLSGKYANHLWEGAAWREYLQDLTPKQVRKIDSNFHYWARPFVAQLGDGFGRLATADAFIDACRRVPLRAKSLAKRAAKKVIRRAAVR